MKIKVFTLNAFGKTETGGNLAGVVLNADCLSEKEMKQVAFKVGFSETAFVQKSNKADYKVRFFTPNEEVDLCGHATIATFSLMKTKKIIDSGKYLQETKAGILEVQIEEGNNVFMTQSLPKFYGELERKEIADSLNIDETIINPNMLIEIVSTGLRDIIIPIKSLHHILSINPDFDKIREVSRKHGVIGYHLFTLETEKYGAAHCRNFAPLYDIPEEAATGTSNGALAFYLFKNNIIKDNETKHLIFEQGYSMNKPSEIIGSLDIKHGEITEVKIGGSAFIVDEVEIEI